VFHEWIGRLLPATPSAGAHGLIRTAHALRALADAETSLRVEELGVALAYWAAYYRTLPGTPRPHRHARSRRRAPADPLFLSGQARPGMPRQVYLRVMQAHGAEFSQAVDSAAEPESVADALSSLTEAGARMYLANATRQPLVLLHTVTAPAALSLMPAPPPGRAAQDGARLRLAKRRGERRGLRRRNAYKDDGLAPQEPSAVIERSVATDDPHALKFAEACIREHRRNPHRAYLAAAADWASRLHRARDWSPAERDARRLGVPLNGCESGVWTHALKTPDRRCFDRRRASKLGFMPWLTRRADAEVAGVADHGLRCATPDASPLLHDQRVRGMMVEPSR